MKGYVYCMSNASLPSVYKIGRTWNIAEREKNLSGTSIPFDYKCEFYIYIDDPRAVEAKIHNILDSFRINQKREFFRLSLKDISDVFNTIHPVSIYEHNNKTDIQMKYDDKVNTSCKRCGYSTIYINNLKAHLRRKIPCDTTYNQITREDLLDNLAVKRETSHQCSICGKQYSSRQGLYLHKRNNENCKSTHVSRQLETMQEELATLRKMVRESSSNNTIINNITINMCSFGHENIKHIENDKDYMTQCFLNRDIMGLIENIHFDIEHPDNLNVRIKSTKKELMETYVDGRWIVSDQEETLDELLNKGYRILNFFSYRNKDHIVQECENGAEEYHEMVEWLEELYSNSKLRKPLKRKLLILFMNNKALFLEKKIDEDVVESN